MNYFKKQLQALGEIQEDTDTSTSRQRYTQHIRLFIASNETDAWTVHVSQSLSLSLSHFLVNAIYEQGIDR